MMTPDVSILIPVYNEEVYLPRCLDSIVRQTLQSWELLLVDDGSTDRSGSICDSYAARDSRHPRHSSGKRRHQRGPQRGACCGGRKIHRLRRFR